MSARGGTFLPERDFTVFTRNANKTMLVGAQRRLVENPLETDKS